LSKQPTHLSSDPPKASTATLAALQFERPKDFAIRAADSAFGLLDRQRSALLGVSLGRVGRIL
jgi:hypothetical protein